MSKNPWMEKIKLTYLFYDLETTGLSPAFDQIIQFAAIRLDENFHEIARYNMRIRLSEDVIPHPQALWVNKISPHLFMTGEHEYKAIQQIYELVNTPGTINVGYNTFGFDEEFFRFSFFRHLLPPYRHQYANECRRMDIFLMVMMAQQVQPDLLKWPIVDGKISFKLEKLAHENNFTSGVSHDALVDVQDTIALAKILHQHTAFWHEATQFFDKQVDKEKLTVPSTYHMIDNANHALGLLLDKFPNSPIIPALHLSEHKKYANQHGWLRLDEFDFQIQPIETVANSVRFLRKKNGESPFVFDYHDERLLIKLSLDMQGRVQNNLQWLTEHPDVFKAMQERFLNTEYHADLFDVNAALYKTPFPTPIEESLLRKFHLIENSRKKEVITQLNPIYQTLAIRLLGRHLPNALGDQDKEIYAQYIRTVFSMDINTPYLDHHGQSKLTVREAIIETDKLLREKTKPEEQQFLQVLKDWYHTQDRLPIARNQQTQTSALGPDGLFMAQQAAHPKRERDEVSFCNAPC